jgi:hypothetical protein
VIEGLQDCRFVGTGDRPCVAPLDSFQLALGALDRSDDLRVCG